MFDLSGKAAGGRVGLTRQKFGASRRITPLLAQCAILRHLEALHIDKG